MSSGEMRRLLLLMEVEPTPFPGNTRPVDKLTALRGADIHKFEPRLDPSSIDKFTAAYIETALWSSTDDVGERLDEKFGPSDIAPGTIAEMKQDCAEFRTMCGTLIAESGLSLAQAGHCFWLTRHGHFSAWGRGLGELGGILADAAESFGTYDLYVGDDGRIHGRLFRVLR